MRSDLLNAALETLFGRLLSVVDVFLLMKRQRLDLFPSERWVEQESNRLVHRLQNGALDNEFNATTRIFAPILVLLLLKPQSHTE